MAEGMAQRGTTQYGEYWMILYRPLLSFPLLSTTPQLRAILHENPHPSSGVRNDQALYTITLHIGEHNKSKLQTARGRII